jgi:hypothetical protein
VTCTSVVSGRFARFHCIDLAQPRYQWIPTGKSWVHQPSLTPANVRVSYGWQATRRLSTVARRAKVDGRRRNCYPFRGFSTQFLRLWHAAPTGSCGFQRKSRRSLNCCIVRYEKPTATNCLHSEEPTDAAEVLHRFDVEPRRTPRRSQLQALPAYRETSTVSSTR